MPLPSLRSTNRVTEGCATMAMSTWTGASWRKPAMTAPGTRPECRGTATSTADQSGVIR